MPFSIWLAFTGASFLLAIAPGPDNLFVLTQSAVHGVRAGVIVVLGLCTGLILQTIAAALGLAAVVAAAPALFWAIKCLGAAYLLYLAFMAWTHAKDGAEGRGAVSLSPFALWRRGVIMNITNPKVLIFFLAFFPQFISRESLTPKTDTLLLGLTFAAVAVVIFTTVALVADYLAAKFSIEQIPPRILAWIQAAVYWLIAVLFVCS